MSLLADDVGSFVDSLDPLVVNPGRLSILMALASADTGTADGIEFVDLRRQTRLTDGNLACHARRLASGGLIDIAKQFRSGKPVTTYLLTGAGRDALAQHVQNLMSAIGPGESRPVRRVADRNPGFSAKQASQHDEDWVD